MIRLRRELSGGAGALARAGDYRSLLRHLGGDWTAKRLKAAHAYITGRNASRG